MTPGTALLLAAALLAAPQQPRDNQRPASTGTATITGIIVTDDGNARPLRRARVMVSGSELTLARAAITSDDGVFAFEGLPAGRYTLTASKAGYAPVSFGATRPERPGRAVVLAGGQRQQVRIRLPRGAVITGMLRDPQGDPAAGVSVVAVSRRFVSGTAERRLVPVPNSTAVTDDRGVYRVFGLAEGTYFVTALPRWPGGSSGEVTAVSREDVQRALAEVQERRAAVRPGLPAPSRPSPAQAERRTGLAFAPTYFPGTTLLANATVLQLGAGEVRSGVDFDLDYVRLVKVEGFTTVHPGTRTQVTLAQADAAAPYQSVMYASPGTDGRFVFPRVPPGHYTVHARAFRAEVRTGVPAPEATYWAKSEIIVSGEDVDGVTLPLEPAPTLSGELVFDSRDFSAPVLEGFRLPLQIGARGTMTSNPFPSVVADGATVSLAGVIPGPYRFNSLPHGIRSRVGRWWLKSIQIDGREALDEALEIPAGAKHLRVTFSDRASELSGRVTDAAGVPVTDGFAVVFSEDPKSWFLHSRRVAAVRLNDEGRYSVRNLPAGRYLIAATSELELNEWFDAEALTALRSQATAVTITEGDVLTRDVTVVQQ